MELKIKKLREGARLPEYMSAGAAAADLYACLDDCVLIPSGGRVLIPTGLAIAAPEGYAAIVCARSGLAAKKGINLSNGIGVIDSDYRGELLVALSNTSDEPFTVENGMRIAQLMLLPAPQAKFLQVSSLDESKRGDGGFGSTGISEK